MKNSILGNNKDTKSVIKGKSNTSNETDKKSKEIINQVALTSSSSINKFSWSWKNTLLIGGGVLLACSGLYYLYKSIFKEQGLPDKLLIELERIKQQIEENKGDLSPDIVIRILYYINKTSEETMNKLEINSRRRDAISNDEEYNKLAKECLEMKYNILKSTTKLILQHFEMENSDFKDAIEQITPYEIEKKIFGFNKSHFESDVILDKNQTKEAYLFYGNKFVEEILNLNASQKKSFKEELENRNHEKIVNKLLIIKMKLDDSLNLKYGVSEALLKYFIHEYSLYDDKEVKSLAEKVNNFDKTMYLG
jgi:hypothetical protein